MIKTYIKHFVLDKFLNSVFDGLMETFDIMPKLVVGKKYRMVIYGFRTPVLNYTPTSNGYNEFKMIIENSTLHEINNNIAKFSGGCISNYMNNVLGSVSDISNKKDSTFTLYIENITMVFE